MIRVKRSATPKTLIGNDSAGGIECADATKFFKKKANSSAKYEFKAYKEKTVKEALERMFGKKCAYCESRYDAVEPMEVEHFRPKGGYESGNKLKTPGYYWLAAEWKNLLPSCIDCNRKRTQPFVDAPPHMSGKANKFPIADEKKRAGRPGQETREERLLLDPCTDRPEEHLVFNGDGTVDPVSDEKGRLDSLGKTSIEVFGLDRQGLVEGRKRMLVFLELALSSVEDLAFLVEKDPGNPRWEEKLAQARRRLEDFTAPDHEYAQFCRQVIDRFERGLTT